MGDCCANTDDEAGVRVEAKKSIDTDSTYLCYCYEFTEQDYRADPSVKDYVIEQTRLGNCSCSTKNPSGKCCLKDFPKKV